MSEQFLTREQRYANEVYIKVQTCIKDRIVAITNEKGEEAAKEIQEDASKDTFLKAYGALAHKLPILIRQSGLVQALAFVRARNQETKEKRSLAKQARNRLIQDLTGTLQAENIKIVSNDGIPLVDRAIRAPFDEYIRLTEACMEALLWFKRFATSELGVDQGMEDDNE